MNSRKLQIEYLPVSSLRADPKNARLHTEKQVKQIARSIQVFGFNVPILVGANLRVIAGHGRLLACGRLGITEVPIIRVEHLSEDQHRAFMIADNRLTENSEWNERLLGEQFEILSEAELNFSLEITGFELPEIDLMIENLTPAVEGAEDPADALPKSSFIQVTQIGDLWQIGKHRVVCGDALSKNSYDLVLRDRRANVIFADPFRSQPILGNADGKRRKQHEQFVMAPSDVGQAEFTKFLGNAVANMATYSVTGSLHYIFMDWHYLREILAAGQGVYSALKDLCVWIKSNAGKGSLYRSQYELVFVFQNGMSSSRKSVQRRRFGRSRRSVWNYPSGNCISESCSEGHLHAVHPTPKLLALIADAIMDCSARRDLVLDPFLGSGTTLIAAERSGRVCCGIEHDPVYVDATIRRWQAFTGNDAHRISDGRSFSECEQEARRD